MKNKFSYLVILCISALFISCRQPLFNSDSTNFQNGKIIISLGNFSSKMISPENNPLNFRAVIEWTAVVKYSNGTEGEKVVHELEDSSDTIPLDALFDEEFYIELSGIATEGENSIEYFGKSPLMTLTKEEKSKLVNIFVSKKIDSEKFGSFSFNLKVPSEKFFYSNFRATLESYPPTQDETPVELNKKIIKGTSTEDIGYNIEFTNEETFITIEDTGEQRPFSKFFLPAGYYTFSIYYEDKKIVSDKIDNLVEILPGQTSASSATYEYMPFDTHFYASLDENAFGNGYFSSSPAPFEKIISKIKENPHDVTFFITFVKGSENSQKDYSFNFETNDLEKNIDYSISLDTTLVDLNVNRITFNVNGSENKSFVIKKNSNAKITFNSLNPECILQEERFSIEGVNTVSFATFGFPISAKGMWSGNDIGLVIFDNDKYILGSDVQKLSSIHKKHIVGVLAGFRTESAEIGTYTKITPIILGKKSPRVYSLSKNDTYFVKNKIESIVCTPSSSAAGATFTGDLNGSDNWSEICKVDDNTVNVEDYPAFNYALNYGISNDLENEYSSGWYIPTAYEFSEIFDNKESFYDIWKECFDQEFTDEYINTSSQHPTYETNAILFNLVKGTNGFDTKGYEYNETSGTPIYLIHELMGIDEESTSVDESTNPGTTIPDLEGTTHDGEGSRVPSDFSSGDYSDGSEISDGGEF